MIGTLIDKYKKYRKQQHLKLYQSYQSKYAFVGVGNHSLSNLYPVIDFLNVPLKAVVSRSLENAEMQAKKYQAFGYDKLEALLDDPEISGIFISSNPKKHFQYAKMALGAGKHVFIEKPACETLEELNDLKETARNNKVNCLVGLQKRYSPVYNLLKKQISGASTYNLRYCTGAYPEGDEVMDLFIHPVDLAIYLFGEVEKVFIYSSGGKGQKTYQVHLQHKNDHAGMIELSTAYTWKDPIESISVNTPQGILESNGMLNLTNTRKPKEVLGIPLEKVLKKPVNKEILFDNSGFVPTMDFNPVYTQGYLEEIKTFLHLVEGKKASNVSSPDQLISTYELLQQLKNH